MDYTNINRRTFLAGSGFGLGQAALAGLLNADSGGVSSSGYLLPKARAKRVIFLCMSVPMPKASFCFSKFGPLLRRANGAWTTAQQ